MRQIYVPLLAMIIFLLFWEALVWVNDWPNYKMASPSDLWPAFWRFKGLFLTYGWETLWRTVVGLLIAIGVGVLLGMVMGFSKVMREGLYPLLVGFNAIPKATVVPIVALMFVGQHDLNTVLIAFMISFFPIAVSVSIGLSTLEPEYRDILRSLGASQLTIFWNIALPKTLPEFFGALKVAVTLAFMEAIVFVAISVAISTRLPIMANLMICFAIYVLGHLTPLIVQSSVAIQAFEPVVFFGQLVATIVPVLDHFNVQAALTGGASVPAAYLGWSFLYCSIYAALAMLLALVFFEDRDLA